MAAFKEHMNIAVLGVGITIVPFHSMGLLSIEQSLVALFFGILGGLAPDLDSDTSLPIQSVFKIFSITLPLIFLLSFQTNLAILKMLLIWFVAIFVLKMIFFKIFLLLTRHRGIFHTIPMGLFFAQLLMLLCYKVFHVAQDISFLYGFFIFLGFIIHLILDEIYSVNVLGARLKTSFGSALKLFDTKNKLGSLILYIFIFSLMLILPSVSEIFTNVVKVFSSMKLF